MSSNVNSGRSANKRAMIGSIDDDANREQPPVKKEAQPVSSQEFVELQQKLAKAEKDKQGAIRIAGEAQARVEFLENLIDKKPAAAVDGKEQKQVDELQKKIDELTKERDDLVSKLAEISYGKDDKLMKKQQKKINKLTNERDDFVSKLGEAEEREKKLAEEHQKKINKLLHKLDQYEDVQKQIQLQLQRFPAVQQSPLKAHSKRFADVDDAFVSYLANTTRIRRRNPMDYETHEKIMKKLKKIK